MKTKTSCKGCKFFFQYTYDGAEKGFCKRYPPQLVYAKDYGMQCSWPEVDHKDWCGEFLTK